jgi:hypothetical protein
VAGQKKPYVLEEAATSRDEDIIKALLFEDEEPNLRRQIRHGVEVSNGKMK